ncbi:hypothetical protein Q3H58_003603 [Pseudomonas psychrotolerans]|nr:hypothetical protein [Pseudomonas psychrotolerans]
MDVAPGRQLLHRGETRWHRRWRRGDGQGGAIGEFEPVAQIFHAVWAHRQLQGHGLVALAGHGRGAGTGQDRGVGDQQRLAFFFYQVVVMFSQGLRVVCGVLQ